MLFELIIGIRNT